MTVTSNQSSVFSFAYNGVGDRLQQTVGGVTTNYALDLNSGLTQVLADGTNNYLYGVGRIGQHDTAAMQYLGADGLGSVRQIYNAAGVVGRNTLYDPFGNVLTTNGTLASVYGYTGEETDATGLVYLRARYYAPGQGRFLLKDPSGMDDNLYGYSNANPINRSDPTGLFSLEGLDGPAAFTFCFAIHSGSQLPDVMGPGGMWYLRQISAQSAVDICKLGFSKDAWASVSFGESPTSAHNLFGIYLYESSRQNRLIFTAKDSLTKELAISSLAEKLRGEYVAQGETQGAKESRFNFKEQLECAFDWTFVSSPPLTCFLGSVYYQMKTVRTEGSEYVGFRIDNRTDLESGTHVAFRFPGQEFGGSVEELLLTNQITGTESILDVMERTFDGKKVLSILRPLSSTETGPYTSFQGSHELGGGNLTQTYVWMEKYDQCDPLSMLRFKLPISHIVEEWPSWVGVTEPIRQWDEAY